MSYIQVDDFKGGLDLRRLQYMTGAGSLLKARNCHINRGGEVEKRRAFVANGALPANTFGLQALDGTLYVFGSVVAPTMPAGYTYQRLQHPDGFAMTGVVRSRLFGGKIYVLADFTDGARLHFYDGVMLTHWYGGITRASMVNNSGIATHLAALIDAHPDYSAAAVGAVITITGQLGVPFTTTATTVNGGSVSDQTAVVAITQNSVAPTAEVAARGSFTVIGGTSNPGTNKVSSITVNGVTITSAAVDWATSNEATAAAIASNISANVSAPDYNANAVGPIVYIDAAPGAGASANNLALVVNCAGDFCVSDGWFQIVNGTASPGVNDVDSVVANGVTISTLNDWITSNAQTAANIAAEINLDATYNAYNVSDKVYVNKRASTSATMGQCVVTRAAGNVDIRNSEGEQTGIPTSVSHLMLTSVVDPVGGVSATAGIAQKTTVTIGGTFDVGDQFTITIHDGENGDIVFGVGSVSGERATDVLTMGTKMYAAVGPLAEFSAVDDATLWNYGTGAGFISIATSAAGLRNIIGMSQYESRIAFLGAEAIQIWSVDPDPDNNAVFQTLENIGTIAYRSLQAYGGVDTYFLHYSGVRSMRQRANTSLASVFDIGTRIDDAVVASINSNAAGAANAISIIEPTTNRYWLYLNGTIYVLTQFEAEGIQAWSTYDDVPAFTEFETMNGRLYARAGDTVYLFGGVDGVTYDETEAEVELPYLNGRKIATFKQWKGLDVATAGVWEHWLNTDPDNPTREEMISKFGGISYRCEADHFDANAPALKLRFRTTSASRALISGVTAHYEETGAT